MEETQFAFDVFLSHSSKDKDSVREVAQRLRADGLRVWFDEWEIKPGDSIPGKIEEGLEQSHVLVLCMSANAFGSDWARLESHTFRFNDPLNRLRRLIPLRLDDAPIKGSLVQFSYINWLAAEREGEYAKLFEACGGEAYRLHTNIGSFSKYDALFEQNEFVWEPGFGDIALLRPEQYGVTFHPEAENILNETIYWAKDQNKKLVLQVMVGSAGSGKTRLMLEACRRLSEQGWVAGFLRTNPPANNDKEYYTWWHNITSDCLVVVDYAEARPSEVIALLKSVHRLKPVRFVRIILLARNTQGWWYEIMLRNRLIRAFAESSQFSGVKTIQAIGKQRNVAKSIFVQAINGYAHKLGCDIPNRLPINQRNYSA